MDLAIIPYIHRTSTKKCRSRPQALISLSAQNVHTRGGAVKMRPLCKEESLDQGQDLFELLRAGPLQEFE